MSEKLFDLGFRDTYREIHPDPVKDPGITHGAGGTHRLRLRGGPSTTLDSKLVGEQGGEDVDIEAAPWTSDHRAVLSSFEMTPVAMPTLIAVDAQSADRRRQDRDHLQRARVRRRRDRDRARGR